MNKNAAVNMHTYMYLFSVLRGMYLRMDLLDHMVGLCLILGGSPQVFSQQLHCFTFPPANHKNSSFPHPRQHLPFSVVGLFGFFFLAELVAFGNSQARDKSRATVVITPDP